MAYENLKKFVEDAIAQTADGRALRLAFYDKPLCKMKDYSFTADERLVLCTMDRQFISDKLPAPKPDLGDYEVESNWPHPGDFNFDPFPAGGGPPPGGDCREFPPAAPAAAGGGGPVILALALAAAGEAWGDPEPHIVNLHPEQGGEGTVVIIVGEGILPGAKVCLRDATGKETALDNVSTNPLDDYNAQNFRRVYIRKKIPKGVTAGLHAIRVRNDPAETVLQREHFIGFGPSFNVL